MIVSFRDVGTRDIYDGNHTRRARQRCPQSLWRIAQRKLSYLEAAAAPQDLAAPPGNRLEKLKDDRAGQYSIRINEQYRICFTWTEQGAAGVEITDYH